MDIEKIKLDRRMLLKAAGTGAVGLAVSGCSEELKSEPKAPAGIIGKDGKRVLPWSNWSGNQSCQPNLRLVPKSEEQVMELVKNSSQTIRCVGAGHSFSPLVPTDETLMSLARIRGIESIDKENKQALIGAGSRLATIGEPLWNEGLALTNMPDINTQALAGAVATSTHGTGKHLGTMSTAVAEVHLVTADGQKLVSNATQNAEYFNALRTNLGALGVVTKLKMELRENYKLRENVWPVKLDEAIESLEDLRDNNRHFEVYALPHADYMIAITHNETDEPETPPEATANGDAYEAFRLLSKVLNYLPFMKGTIINMGVRTIEPEERVGRSYEIFGNVRDIRFNEMEYSIPAEYGPKCIREILDTIKKKNIDIIFPIEYRYVQADNVWLSPFYQRDCCSISCHNFHDKDYKAYFAEIEPILLKYDGRPHWGKLHTLTAKEFTARYPMFNEFLKVRQELDPQGKFLNKHLKTAFGIS